MEVLPQLLANGTIIGGTYALLGIGLTLIFGLMGVVNFAHGEFYTLGAYAAFFVLSRVAPNFILAVLGAMLAGAIVGALVDRLLAPLRHESIDTTMLLMIGVWIVMQNLELLTWGGVSKTLLNPFSTQPVVVGPISIGQLRLFVFGVALVLIASSHLLIHRTKLGRAMRATFQDQQAAALMGVGIERIYTFTFAFGATLAAAAGALLGAVFLVYPGMGDLALTKAFSVVILGGLGNFGGAAAGGLILGLAEELGAGYISSGYRDAIGFLLIIVVLLFKPSGLFARAERVG